MSGFAFSLRQSGEKERGEGLRQTNCATSITDSWAVIMCNAFNGHSPECNYLITSAGVECWECRKLFPFGLLTSAAPVDGNEFDPLRPTRLPPYRFLSCSVWCSHYPVDNGNCCLPFGVECLHRSDWANAIRLRRRLSRSNKAREKEARTSSCNAEANLLPFLILMMRIIIGLRRKHKAACDLEGGAARQWKFHCASGWLISSPNDNGAKLLTITSGCKCFRVDCIRS